MIKKNNIANYFPKISIVTPSFNQGQFLRETIESILNQNYPNLEYFIVDGGSTDNSIEIIREYEDRIDWWVSEKDSGQSCAINKGFKRATGDLFNWINSDDILFPGALHIIANSYRKHPNADIFVVNNARGNAEGRIIRVSCPPSKIAISPANWLFHFGQQSTFFSAKTYKQAGGIREDLHGIMDSDFYYRILTNGGIIAYVHGMIGMIRTHDAAKGEARKEIWEDEIPRIRNEYGFSSFLYKLASLKISFVRCVDGSYLRSYMHLKKWRGKKPWDLPKY